MENAIPSLNQKQDSNLIFANNSFPNKTFEQKAREHLFNAYNNLFNNNNNSLNKNQEELEKKQFDDTFTCPKENCGHIFSGKTNLETLRRLELKNVFCNKCRNYYKFMLCPHCNKKIYFSMDLEFQDPLGFTIICPYVKSCGKAFFKINCGECGETQTYKEAKAENSVLKCANELCGKETSFIRCPKNDCKKLMIFKSNKGETVEAIVNQNIHLSLNLFNKRITCDNSFCWASFVKFLCNKCNSINFTFSADYFEGAEIICQNKDCNAAFKKINCPICSKEETFPKLMSNEKDAELGVTYQNRRIPDLIECTRDSCCAIFSKITCPNCKTDNHSLGKKNFLEGKKIKCASALCATEFSYFNCAVCNEINFWKKSKKPNPNSNDLIDLNFNQNKSLKNNSLLLAENNKANAKTALIKKEIKDAYVRGQPVKCANCNITTSKINCPYCLEIVTFSDIPFKYGINYTCFNVKCLQNFFINLCPCCFKTKIHKGKRIYTNFLICPSEKTSENHSLFANGKNLSLNLKSNLDCKLKCKQKYDFVICFQCSSYLFYYENEFNPNMALRCPLDTCKCVFLSFNCRVCTEKILLREYQLEEEFVYGECPNKACKNPFKFIYCFQCKFVSETNFANYKEYTKSKKSLRKNLALSNSRKKSTNSQHTFCTHCAEANQDFDPLNDFHCLKFEDCQTTSNHNKKENKALPVNFNPFVNEAYRNPEGNLHDKNFLNFSEDEKGGNKFNILKHICFANGFSLRKPVYQLDSKLEEFSESLRKKISINLLSVYDRNPTYEKCSDCNKMKESLVLFAPCGHKTSCENCCKLLYVTGFSGSHNPKKCSKCSKGVTSYVKKIYN